MEMADASKVMLSIENSKLPLLSGAHGYAKMGIFPGGAFDNKNHLGNKVRFDEDIAEPDQMLLFDPQTSGGLLLGVPQEKLEAFKKRADELNQPAWVIGEVHAGTGIEVRS